MSDPQHDIRLWLSDQLKMMGHGGRGRLAAHLGVRADAITRMANMDPAKETREIKAHELEQIRAFFAAPPREPIVGSFDPDADEPTEETTPPRPFPTDAIQEIDVTAGLGGGGLAILEATSNEHGMTFAAEVVRDFWRLPTWVLGRFNAQAGHIKAFPSQGDSMEPTISDGDVVFADIRHRVPSPPGIYVLADEFGGVVVKRLEVVSRPRDENVVVRVISDNPRHEPRDLMLDEINIIGRYVGRFTT